MAKKKSVLTVVFKALWVVILLVVLIGGVLVVAKYTNGFTDEPAFFYVEYDDSSGKNIIYRSNDNIVFAKNSEVMINVKYTLSAVMNKANQGYKVNVIPASGVDFDYTLDGATQKFSEIKFDLAVFNYVAFDNYFIMNFMHSDIAEYIIAQHKGKAVSFDSSLDKIDKKFLTLVVESASGKESVNLTFGVLDKISVDSVIVIT